MSRQLTDRKVTGGCHGDLGPAESLAVQQICGGEKIKDVRTPPYNVTLWLLENRVRMSKALKCQGVSYLLCYHSWCRINSFLLSRCS